MAYNSRPQSPGGRRIQNPARASDNRVSDIAADQYRESRHNSTASNAYTSPRSSGGVIPISTETFVNYPPTQANRVEPQRYDSYTNAYQSSRSRGTSVSESQRNSISSSTQSSARTRPNVVQNETARPASPIKGSQTRDYYVTPSTTKEPRKEAHKRVYTVNDGTANLVADVNFAKDKDGERERHHRRRESEGLERGGSIRPPSERDRARRGYHLNGPTRRVEKSVDDDDAFSYTTPAGMYKETEPSWREHEVRPRRNSIDRAGGSRERPILDPLLDSRRLSRDIGPPPSTRGWDKVNDMARSRSTRDRTVAQSPTRSRVPMSPGDPRMTSPPRGRFADAGGYGDPRDPYYVAPRRVTAVDRRYDSQERPTIERYDMPDYREPRRHERRHSTTRVPDRSVERRGFGIRSDSKDRYGRESDESFNQQNYYRDSAYAVAEPPQRRDTAPEFTQHDEQRFEQEKRDRQAERDARERESRRYEEEPRGYERDHERDRTKRRERDTEYDVDRERERARERMMQPQPPAEPDRSHHRDDGYREREYDRSPRDTSESIAQPGLSTAAAGGLAAAAAGYGVTSHQNRNDDRDRDRNRDRDQDRRHERSYDNEHERTSPRPPDPRPPQGSRTVDTHSDEGVQYRQDSDRHRSDDNERGLGFAFEAPPDPPKSAPPIKDRQDTTTNRDTAADREFERTHEDDPPDDPDEDYRRRKEQVQRELGLAPEDRASDSDPDRERRRREREQRFRDREPRNGESSTVGSGSTYTDPSSAYQVPGAFDNESVDDSADGRPPLRRRRSILDEPLTGEPAQIIDNSMSEKRENRVRIVDPPTEEEEKKPKGILKKPKDKFPEHPNEVREGVAPLKDATKSGIPPGARWTKIDRRLVNPEALEDAKERFEERLDCVIVLRVLTKEDIQKLADRTKAIRDERYQEERDEKKAARRRERERDRRERDEYENDSENEFKPRAPKMLEAPASSAGASSSAADGDYAKERDRRRDRDWDRERERDDY